MTIQEMHDLFNLLLDQYNEPYFEDDEIDQLINSASIDFVNDIVFNNISPSFVSIDRGISSLSSVESTIQSSEVLSSLIFRDLELSSSDGAISFDDINTELLSESSDTEAEMLHIINVVKLIDEEEHLVRFVRNNDRQRFKQNVFKSPKVESPIFTISNSGILIEPKDDEDYLLTVIKKPRKVSLGDEIDSDLPENTHQRIVAYALALSGLASRDEVMLQLQNVSGNGSNRQQ